MVLVSVFAGASATDIAIRLRLDSMPWLKDSHFGKFLIEVVGFEVIQLLPSQKLRGIV